MVEREEEGERKEISEKDVTYILVYTTIGQPNSVRIKYNAHLLQIHLYTQVLNR